MVGGLVEVDGVKKMVGCWSRWTQSKKWVLVTVGAGGVQRRPAGHTRYRIDKRAFGLYGSSPSNTFAPFQNIDKTAKKKTLFVSAKKRESQRGPNYLGSRERGSSPASCRFLL